MKKRIFSLAMVLALCLTLLPASALAEGTEGAESGAAQVTTAEGTEQVYDSFNDAWSAAIKSEGSTLKLLSDVELSKEVGENGLPVSEGSFTLDLNNKTLQGAIWNQLLEVSGTANITIKNGSLVNTVADGNSAAIGSTLLALNISGGTVALENVNLTSGIVQAENYGHNPALYITGGSLAVTGSTFTGQVMVDCTQPDKRPVLSITDATLNNGIFYGVMGVQGMDTAGLKAIFTDGSMLFDRDEKYIDLASKEYWHIENVGASFFYTEKCIVKQHTHEVVNGQCTACGATFAASVTQNGAVTYYEDFAKALDAWLANGGTLKLYADYTAATEKATWTIVSGEHSIDLNGHMMSVQDKGAFKPTNNMHLTVTDGKEIGQIDNILLDGSQRGSFTLESGYVGNLEMTGGAVVALKGGSIDKLDVQNCSANTNLSIQGGRIGELNIKDWFEGMHVSATSGSLGAYTLPSGKILADVLDHQYYAEGTSLNRQVDTAQPVEKFVIKHAPYDFGSTSKTAEVPMNGRIPFTVDSPSENVGVYDVKWYRRTNSGAEHMTENRVADVNVGDTLDVFCVITGLDRPNGAMQWQVAVKGYTLQTLPPSLENAEIIFADGGQERTFWPDPNNPSVGKTEILSSQGHYTVTLNGETLKEGTDYTVSGNVATGIGTYDLKITGIAPHYSGTKTVQWTVVPHKLNGLWVTPCSKQYDGTVALPAGVFSEKFESANNYGQITLQEGTDYIVTDARFDTPDASNENKPYRYTVELKNPNYVFANGTKVQTWVYGVDVNATIEITQADAPAAREGALEVINNHADTYTVDLATLLPALESPKTYGEITYGRPAVWLDSGYYTAGNAKVENGKLILTIDKNPVTTTGSIGTVTVKVSTTNYHDFPLTINVNAANKSVSYSGDSNPTVKSETTTNPDGSVTKTETKSDGTKVETTTGKDGSVSQTTTNPNGSSVTETKAADGSTGTVKTDKHGKTEASVNISSKAVEEAKTTGNAVQIPAVVEASKNSSTAPTVEIHLPTNAGETKVEIPVSNVNSGTVAVLVHPDGTEEIVKFSIPTETGIQLTVTGSTTIKIIDNTKPFQDINGHWAEKSIDFVGARELFMGTGTKTFSPDVDMSRAQLWTVLARQGNADLSGGSNWYEKSQLWAVDKGISDGTNPQDSISRAQMISMLWRTAGSPGTTDSPRFTDVPADAYYTDAVAWATKNNITSGVGNGKFDPNAACTRAQIAVFLHNAYENDIF